jgi:Acetoacetate decarboxylase (ADC)
MCRRSYPAGAGASAGRLRNHRRVAFDPPPAPWRSDIDALVWWHRSPARAGAAALPAPLRGWRALPVGLGALVSYRRGPVGPYAEVFAGRLLVRTGRPHAHVAFIAVDSQPSIAGGRANWALPKEAARFEGAPGRPGRVRATGDGWSLTVEAAAWSPRLPAWAALPCVQAWPDGRALAFTVCIRGTARLAEAQVAHEPASGPALGPPPGRHPAVLVSGRQVVTPARPA